MRSQALATALIRILAAALLGGCRDSAAGLSHESVWSCDAPAQATHPVRVHGRLTGVVVGDATLRMMEVTCSGEDRTVGSWHVSPPQSYSIVFSADCRRGYYFTVDAKVPDDSGNLVPGFVIPSLGSPAYTEGACESGDWALDLTIIR